MQLSARCAVRNFSLHQILGCIQCFMLLGPQRALADRCSPHIFEPARHTLMPCGKKRPGVEASPLPYTTPSTCRQVNPDSNNVW